METYKPVCYFVPSIEPNRFWQTGDIIKEELPAIALQMAFITIISRLCCWMFRPLHQSLLISYVVGGAFIKMALSYNGSNYLDQLYPMFGMININVLSNFGLMYHSFLSGLEMNMKSVLHAQKKAINVAFAGIIFPLVIGPALYGLFRKTYTETGGFSLEKRELNACVLWTAVLTVTSFPILAHILSELKLLYTGLGKTTLTAAMISDTYSWFLFIVCFPFAMNHGDKAIYSVLSTVLFLVFCFTVVHPVLCYYIERKTDQDSWDDSQLLCVVMGVVVCAFITDFLGTHSIVGAFVYGLMLPHGKFADLVTSISDDFGSGFLAPIYFFNLGIRISMNSIYLQENWAPTLIVIVLLSVPKILGTIFVSFFFGLRTQDGFALGLLLNTKGVMALIMLNNGWDRKVFSEATFTTLSLGILLMTLIVPPVINLIYKPRRRFEQNKLKTIQKLRNDVELRILACVYNARNAKSMINILATFNPTRISPMHVFGLHLVELTGRTAAIVAAHIDMPTGVQAAEQNLTRTQAELISITNIFEAFGDAYDAVREETLNIVSSYETIHEDIHHMANEKHTSLILLPFHKHITVEGYLETTSEVYQEINQNTMIEAPCSVGIFVDREIGSVSKINFRINMLFVGGPDDREALAIAARMAEHPGVRLSVVRMLLLEDPVEVETSSPVETQGVLYDVIDSKKQKELDEEYVSSFRLTQMNNDDFISYVEFDVLTDDDVIPLMKEIEKGGCDLYIVGKGNCRSSKIFSNLGEWCDCTELGVIGDILASDNFNTKASVLVVQQYGYGGNVLEKQNNNNANTISDGFESIAMKTI
ncbi:hypothetical protein RIF29_19620 [Crotalaria pallida]|uniref:Cation/H+ exchanger domain-containing protein n=1 Tax=Crotalaria pallida TaxID=3830 RepID=A0AAN9F850_CROPI